LLLAAAVLAGSAGVGCLLDPCSATDYCGSAVIYLKTLDPSLAGAVQFTIRRQDLPSEQATCSWQAATATPDAGPAAPAWTCDPVPSAKDSASVTYDTILVNTSTTYELTLTGPAGMAVQPIAQLRVTAGDACGCTRGSFQVPDAVWTQAGAM
jgi:hypothetical protein